MESLIELYRIGRGPSSSHTMGPCRASRWILDQYPEAQRYVVHLYGSLATTGRGHLTDFAIHQHFEGREMELINHNTEELPGHPNGMRFEIFDGGKLVASHDIYSTGGGAIEGDGFPVAGSIYPHSSMAEILNHCSNAGMSFHAYVFESEPCELRQHLTDVWQAMKDAIQRGIHAEGTLPGGLNLARKAHGLYRKSKMLSGELQHNGLLAAYANAVSEENASGGVVVTAPTCGSCGIMPAVLHHLQQTAESMPQDITNALATAGLIGNLIKTNASISGAEVGCQGEVGAACSMAAAAATQLLGGTLRQIEYAAEMGLEHHLGLTCDPIKGLVQIPCIERNAHAASRAIACAHYALLSDGQHRVSFDQVVDVLKETGHALPSLYRETAQGGLAKRVKG